MSLLALYVLQPVGGFLAETIGRGATEAGGAGRVVTGFLLGGFFLPLVMMGVHQASHPSTPSSSANLAIRSFFHPCHAGAGRWELLLQSM